MASFTGQLIKDTYDAILKAIDNGVIDSTAKNITDGVGNVTPLFISTTQVGIGVTPSTDFHVNGSALIGGSLTITGDLTVNGSTTTISTQTLSVEDPLIILAKDNAANSVDIGFYGKYVDGSTKYAGLFRKAGDNKFHIFSGLGTEPTTTVNTGDASYVISTLVGNLEGNVTGNLIATGAGATQIMSDVRAVTQSANDNSTKIATTAYVDTSAGNFLPLAGGTMSGNIAMGSNNISGGGTATFTSFVGELTGNASTSTKIASITNSDIVQLTSSQTLTNKTINVDNNTVSNIEVDNLKSGVLDTDLNSVSGSDDTLASAKSIVTFVNQQVTAQDLDFAGGSGTGAVDLDSQTFTIAGTTNEIETSASGQTLTVGLPSTVVIGTSIGSPIFSTGEGVNNKIFFLGNYGNWRINISDSANQLVIHSESGVEDYLTVKGGGTIQLNNYGSGNKTGTVAKNLAVDSSGNIIETDGGVVDGSGTANDVVMWSDSNTLTDAPIAISGNNATFSGQVEVALASNQIKLSTGTAGDGYLNIGHFANGTFIGTYGDDGGAADLLRFGVHSGDVALTINSDKSATFVGNVSITKASTPELVLTDTTNNHNLLIAVDDSNTFLRSSSGVPILFQTNGGTTALTLSGANSTFAGNVTVEGGTLELGKADTSSGHINAKELMTFNIDTDNDDTNRYFGFYKNGSDGGGTELLRIEESGNVGIGTASPSAKLHVVGETRVYTGSSLGYWGVDAGNSYVYFGTNTSNYSLSFQTSGAEKMRLDSAGNLGIGNSSPVTLKSATTLQVNGNAKLGDANDRGLLSLGDIASTGANAGIWRGAAGAYGSAGNFLNIGGYDGITFTTGNADISSQTLALTIDSSQNANFEGDVTADKLVIDGASNSNVSQLALTRTDYSWGIFNETNLRFYVQSGNTTTPNTQVLEIGTSGNSTFAGNLGIGTTPNAKLSLAGGSNINSQNSILYIDTNSNYASSADRYITTSTAARYIQLNGEHIWSNAPSGTAGNAISFAERMRLDSSGRVGIGMTPSDYTGYMLQISGTTQALMSFGNSTTGTGALNGLIVGNDATGADIYQREAQPLRFHTSNTLALTIDASQNVGINETSPNAKLDVSGNVKLGSAAHSSWTDAKQDSGGLGVFVGSGSYAFQVWDDNDQTNARFVVERAGNVGIGTSSPNAPLEATKAITFSNADTIGQFLIKSAVGATGDMLNFGVDSTNSLAFIQANEKGVDTIPLVLQRYGGNVGIGTTSPSAILHTDSASTGEVVGLALSNSNTSFTANESVSIKFGVGSSTALAHGKILVANTDNGFGSNGYMAFHTRGSDSVTERMRISSSGDILFGTTSMGNDFAYFDAESNNRRVLNLGSSSTSQQTLVNFRNPNGVVGELQTDGSTTSFVTSSDYRLKENVVEMTNALDRVSQLKPSRFNFIANPDKTYDGFLAHEVKDIVPEAISGDKDEVDEDGNEKYQGIDQSKLVPLLVGAIQELRAEIEILKNKN